MPLIVKSIRANERKWAFGLIAIFVCVAFICAFAPWYVSVCFIFSMYLILSYYLYVVTVTRNYEVPLLFITYLGTTAIFILLFAIVSWTQEIMSCGDPEKMCSAGRLDHYFYSLSMVTMLGVSNFEAITETQKWFTITQVFFGASHTVTFLLVALGSTRWIGESRTLTGNAAPSVLDRRVSALELQMRYMAKTLKLLLVITLGSFVLILYLAAKS